MSVARYNPLKRPKETVGTIQGRRAASFPEWRFAVALWKFKIPFKYQMSFFGGRRLKGGQIVDFMVYTHPATAVFVDGEYWHGTASQIERDRLKRALLKTQLGRAPVVLVGADLADQKLADAQVIKLFGDRR